MAIVDSIEKEHGRSLLGPHAGVYTLLYQSYIYRPTDGPRVVTFVVTDQLSLPSLPATATINFNSIDNPPVLDLNGPAQPGNDFSVIYTEGDPSVRVSVRQCPK